MRIFAAMLCVVESLEKKVDKLSEQVGAFCEWSKTPLPPPKKEKTEKEFFTVREVAAILGNSEKTVRRLQQRGFFKSSKAQRTKRIPRSEIDRYRQETV